MNIKPRAILVCVDYCDLLRVTLPLNEHHFSELMVVTSLKDTETQDFILQTDHQLYITDSFYDDGAVFNKWKALEEALDRFGRRDWMCIMDADVVWPKVLPVFPLQKNCLYTPLRRMYTQAELPLPQEHEWKRYKIHFNVNEWAGYSQLFHAEDRHLPEPPWHQIDWIHAGGADSFFQALWPMPFRKRPPFEVLHIGEAGKNWCGRATKRLDGNPVQEAPLRQATLQKIMTDRHKHRREADRFAHEKIPPTR